MTIAHRGHLRAVARDLRDYMNQSTLGHPVLVGPADAGAQALMLARHARMCSASQLAATLESCSQRRTAQGEPDIRLILFGYGMKLNAEEFWRSSLEPAHAAMVNDPRVGLERAVRRWNNKTIDWGTQSHLNGDPALMWTDERATLTHCKLFCRTTIRVAHAATCVQIKQQKTFNTLLISSSYNGEGHAEQRRPACR